MKTTEEGPFDGHICCIADGCRCEPALAVAKVIADQAERVTDGLSDVSPAVIQTTAGNYVYVEIAEGSTNVLVYYNRRCDRGRKGRLWMTDAATRTDGMDVKLAKDRIPDVKSGRVNPSVEWMIRDLCADLTRNRCRTKRHQSRRPYFGDEGDAGEVPGGHPIDRWSLQQDIDAAMQSLNEDERWLFELRQISGWPRPKIVELTGYSEKRLRIIEVRLMNKLQARLKAYAA